MNNESTESSPENEKNSLVNFAARLEWVIDRFCNGTSAVLATKVDVSPSYVSMLLSGRRDNPSEKFIEGFRLSNIPVNVHWLITGEGEVVTERNAEESHSELHEDFAPYLTITNAAELSKVHRSLKWIIQEIPEGDILQKLHAVIDDAGLPMENRTMTARLLLDELDRRHRPPPKTKPPPSSESAAVKEAASKLLDRAAPRPAEE